MLLEIVGDDAAHSTLGREVDREIENYLVVVPLIPHVGHEIVIYGYDNNTIISGG